MTWGCLLLGHMWTTHQYAVKAEGTGLNPGDTFVIAWKQCSRCAASRLLHIFL